MGGHDLLKRYSAGERDFRSADLQGGNMEGAILDGVNLSAAQCHKATTWAEGFTIPSDMKFVSEGPNSEETESASPPPVSNPESLDQQAD
ncbi:MAG: pentapeptide repeat-containing protein [Anaerolineae bacterium]